MRGSKNREINNKVLIITNGKDTEKNYFEILKNKNKSPYSTDITYENKDPLQLVEKAILRKDDKKQFLIIVKAC